MVEEPNHATSKNLNLYKSLKTLWRGKCNLHRRQTKKVSASYDSALFYCSVAPACPQIYATRETAWVVVGTLENCPSIIYVFLSDYGCVSTIATKLWDAGFEFRTTILKQTSTKITLKEPTRY